MFETGAYFIEVRKEKQCKLLDAVRHHLHLSMSLIIL